MVDLNKTPAERTNPDARAHWHSTPAMHCHTARVERRYNDLRANKGK